MSASHGQPCRRIAVQAEPVIALERPVIFVIDDDHRVRDRLRGILVNAGRVVEDYATTEDFLEAPRLHRLSEAGSWLPTVVINGQGNASISVQVLLTGTVDLIAKPIEPNRLLGGVKRALEQARDRNKPTTRHAILDETSRVTPRQIQIMEMVLAGHPSKNIAADLGISQRTVESHRASIMKKTGAKSLPALTRLAFGGA